MSVVAERVVAPHGWLRYDVERIRSVRHLTDPTTRPDRTRGVRFLCEALSGVEAQHRVELHELTGSRGTGLTGSVLTGALSSSIGVFAGAPWLVGRRGDRGRGGAGRDGCVPVCFVVLVFVFVFVFVFGEGPRGEVRVVQVPAESLDSVLVDHVLRSPAPVLSPAEVRAPRRLVTRCVGVRSLLGPVADVVGDAPAQVVPHGVRGDPRLGPGAAVLVLVGIGLELSPDQHRLTLVHAGAHVVGQPIPAADGEIRGLAVVPLPGRLVAIPGRDADAQIGDRLTGLGGANARLLGHIADEGHKGALAHVDPPWIPGGPTPPGPSTVPNRV